MIRTFIPSLGTWAFVGYPLYAQSSLIQPVSIFGLLGLDMLIISVNFVLAQAAFEWFDRRWRWEAPAVAASRVRRWLKGVALACAVWFALSVVVYLAERPSSMVRVAAIQPNFPHAAHMDESNPTPVRLARLAQQTRQAAAQGARIIVWPELSVAFDPQTEHTQELHDLARETQAHLIIGYGMMTAAGFRNEATVLTPQGQFLGIYGKAHPTLFGGEPYGINVGTFPVYHTVLGRLGTIICFDADFTDAGRKLALQGAQLIAVPSSDFPGIAEIHYTHAVMRAVENRVAVVKADSAYDSAIIGPRGELIEWVALPSGGESTLVADVPLGTGKTWYSRFGDCMGWVNLAGMVFFMLPNPLLKGKKPA